MDDKGEIIICQSADGETGIEVTAWDETVWLPHISAHRQRKTTHRI